jgi:hypothetical protein
MVAIYRDVAPKPEPAKGAERPKLSVQPIGPLKRGRPRDALSERQTKPWVTLKISERTYYRLKRQGKL